MKVTVVTHFVHGCMDDFKLYTTMALGEAYIEDLFDKSGDNIDDWVRTVADDGDIELAHKTMNEQFYIACMEVKTSIG